MGTQTMKDKHGTDDMTSSVSTLGTIGDYVVDISGIIGICVLALYTSVGGQITVGLGGMIASIALGKRYFDLGDGNE